MTGITGAFAAPTFIQPSQTAASSGGSVGPAAIVSGTSFVTYNISLGGSSVQSGVAPCVSDWQSAAMGSTHCIGLKKDGSIWAWGDNSAGQLGVDNTLTTASSSPVRIGTGSAWKEVFARGSVSAGLKTDGTFWVWGNGFTSTPQQVARNASWAAGSLGDVSALLLTSSGALYEMTFASPQTAVRMGTDSDWASVSTGFMMMSAIKTDGTLWNRPLNTVSTWSTVAGQSRVRGASDGEGTAALFDSPFSIAAESGTLYVATAGFHPRSIRKITSGGQVTTLTTSCCGQLAVRSGTVFVADGNAVYKITGDGQISVLAGGTTGSADGTGADAQFNGLRGIAVNPDGILYVSDSGNYTIRKVTQDGVVTTVAGVPGVSGSADGPAGVATFKSIGALGQDSIGNLYIADKGSYASGDIWPDRIRKLGADGKVTTLAGGAATGWGGLGREASLPNLDELAVDSDGTIYASAGMLHLKKVTPTGQVTTVGGWQNVQGHQDGPAEIAQHWQLAGFAIDSGTLYAADIMDQTIRKIVFSTPLVKDVHGGFVKIGGSDQWSKVSAGNEYAMGLKKDGTVWAWGRSSVSATGNNAASGIRTHVFVSDSVYHSSPVKFSSSAGWTDIAASDVPLALNSAGKLYFLNEENLDSSVTTPNLSGLSNKTGIKLIPRGSVGYSGEKDAMLLTQDGILWTWGRNDCGQRGNYITQVSPPGWGYWYDDYTKLGQVGVNPAWGLSSPVSGIPIDIAVANPNTNSPGGYTLFVTDPSGARASLSFAAVAWSQHPAPVRTVVGSSYFLSASANAGSGNAVARQWLRNGTLVSAPTQTSVDASGVATTTLSVSNAADSQAGVYQLRVCVGSVQARSEPVVVTVESGNVALARSALGAGNYTLASSLLTTATLNGLDGTAQILRAALNLYNLWNDPATTAALSNLGFTGSADPWNFTLALSDSGFPSGALSSSARTWLVSTLYPKLKAADDGLATITDTAFITTLRAADLHSGAEGDDIYIDYGDVSAVRAFLNTGMALVKWIETQNTDVDLYGLQMDRSNGRLSMETLLGTANKYANLLTASSTAAAAGKVSRRPWPHLRRAVA